jgi:hypothetical protein
VQEDTEFVSKNVWSDKILIAFALPWLLVWWLSPTRFNGHFFFEGRITVPV